MGHLASDLSRQNELCQNDRSAEIFISVSGNPVYLTKSYFSQIDKMISEFIWSCQNPRISKGLFQRPRTGGGLAQTNFKGYYWAANVHKISYWMQSPDTDWCKLEGMSSISSSMHWPYLIFLVSFYNSHPTQ